MSATADDILDAFSLMKSFFMFIKMSLKFIPKDQVDNNPALD